MNLFIFTLATNVYNKYLDAQIQSFKYLFPNIDNKYMIVLSDLEYKFPFNSHIISVQIPNIHYNLTCISKLNYCVYALNKLRAQITKDDIYMFFDADTIYIERPMEIWQSMTNILMNHDLVVNPYVVFGWDNDKMGMCEAYGEVNPDYAGYYHITDKSVNICSNVFGGTLEGLKRLTKDFMVMLDHDINIKMKERHFPCVNEETYFNKIVNDNIEEKNDYKIFITMMHYTPFPEGNPYYDFLGSPEDQIEKWPTIICNSKYNNNYKVKTSPKFETKSQIVWRDYVDYIYVIGTSSEQLNMNKFSAVDISDYRYIPYSEYEIIKADTMNDKNKNITVAHYNTILEAYNLGYDKVLIMEDNCRFIERVAEIKKALEYTRTNEEEIDIMMFDYVFNNEVYYPISSTCYYISRKGMEQIIEYYKSQEKLFNIKYILSLPFFKDSNIINFVGDHFEDKYGQIPTPIDYNINVYVYYKYIVMNEDLYKDNKLYNEGVKANNINKSEEVVDRYDILKDEVEEIRNSNPDVEF